MSKRIGSIERRINDLEKSIDLLRELLPSTDDYKIDCSGMSDLRREDLRQEDPRQEDPRQEEPMGGDAADNDTNADDLAGGYTGANVSVAQDERIPINSRQETPGVLHNHLGEPYSIKLVYPAFYHALDVGIPYCTVGFPAAKEKLAKQVQQGTLFFVYVTSPMRRVIGLAQAMGPAEYRGDVDAARPWVVPLEWVIGPKADGVSFAEVGLEVRARTGDSVYSVPVRIALAFMERLRTLCDLDRAEVARLRDRFKF